MTLVSPLRTLLTARRRRRILPLILLALLATSAGDGAAAPEDMDSDRQRERYGDLVSIFSGDITVPENVYRRGMVFSLGGDVEIAGTAREVVVISGSLRITGEVRGQVVGVFTDMDLDGAEIGGQLVNVLGGLEETDSYIDGPRINITPFGGWFPGVGALLFWGRMFMLFCGFIVLILLAAIVPDRIRVMGEEAPVRYVPAFFVGILGYLGLLVMFSLLSVTLIGIPLAMVAIFVLRWLGTAGLFYAFGRRLGRGFGAEMSVFGALLISFTIYGVLKLAPTPLGIVGLALSGILWTLYLLLIDIPAIGLVILTRMGSRPQPAPAFGGGPTVITPPPAAAPPPPAGTPEPPTSPGGHSG
jgi:hypothetical protein